MNEELDALATFGLAKAREVIDEMVREEAEARERGDVAAADEMRVLRRARERAAEMVEEGRSGRLAQQKIIKLRALVNGYIATGKKRPKLLEVAEQMGWDSEQPLRDLCREVGIESWHDVHLLVAALPR